MAIDLNDQTIPDDQLGTTLEEDLTHKPDASQEKEGQQDQVPYHEDKNVQAYIERQVQKRLGEGNAAWEDRLDRLERTLTQPKQQTTPTKIGDWTPASESDAQAAKAIVQQAKQEMLDDLQQQQEAVQQQIQQDDLAFNDLLGELDVTGVVKKEQQKEFAQMISDYKIDDSQSAIKLWERLQEVKAQGRVQGEEVGIKRAQEAKIGSARTGREPGSANRSYQERKASEPNFNAILERELTRLGQ